MEIEKELAKIKKDLDRIELELAMNSEGIESIEMSLRLLEVELDHDIRGSSSAG